MKIKSISYFKTQLILALIALLSIACQDEELTLETKQNSNLNIPTIEKTQNNFSKTNLNKASFFSNKHGVFQRNNKSQIFNIDWKASHVREFKENVNLLYTPVFQNIETRTKTILASVLNKKEIETYAYTMVYDDKSSNKQFSGLIFKHDILGNFVSAYKYTNGTKIETYILNTTKQTNINSKNSGNGCTISIEDIIFDYANGGTGDILDCVVVRGGGSSGGDSRGSNDWSNPNNNLIDENDGGGGGSTGNFGNPNNDGDENNNSDGDQLYIEVVDPWWAEDDQVINELTGKAKCIYDKLQHLSNGFKNTIKKFDSEFTLADIKFKLDDTGGTVKVEDEFGNIIGYDRAFTSFPDANNLITISINNVPNSNNNVDSQPNLLLAQTIAHEVIHAEMFRQILNAVESGSIIGLNNQDVLDALASSEYTQLYEYFRQYQNWSHTYMAEQFRDVIARITQEFNTGTSVPDTVQPQQLYLDLAWRGLMNNVAWDNEGLNQTAIESTINNYVSNNSNETCID